MSREEILQKLQDHPNMFKELEDSYINLESAAAVMEEILKDYVPLCVYEQVTWERNIALEQLQELGYSLGQKTPIDYDQNTKKKLKETEPITNDSLKRITKHAIKHLVHAEQWWYDILPWSYYFDDFDDFMNLGDEERQTVQKDWVLYHQHIVVSHICENLDLSAETNSQLIETISNDVYDRLMKLSNIALDAELFELELEEMD